MKKLYSLMLLCAAVVFASCEKDDSDISVEGVTLNKQTLSLEEGKTETLTATVTPSDINNKEVIWSTSDQSIATVNEAGLVTALKAGTTTITATSVANPKKEGSCVVTVSKVLTAIKFDIPDFKESYVYLVKDDDKLIAEICNEYLPEFSTTKRATVVYLADDNGNIDHKKGFIADNGGSFEWKEEGNVYTAGTEEPVTALYVDGGVLMSTAEPLKTVIPAPDKLKDADNNEYRIVKIGTQYWLAENMKSTKMGNGTALPMNLSVADWCTNTTGAALLYQPAQPVVGGDPLPDDLSTPDKIKANYGLLYNWEAAKVVAPNGWHLPSTEEWIELGTYLIDANAAGGMLKEEGLAHWDPYFIWEWIEDENGDEVEIKVDKGNVGATNITGFSAVGAGYIYSQWPDMPTFSFSNPKSNTYWWTSSKDADNMIGNVSVDNSSASFWNEELTTEDSHAAFSVRLIRNK